MLRGTLYFTPYSIRNGSGVHLQNTIPSIANFSFSQRGRYLQLWANTDILVSSCRCKQDGCGGLLRPHVIWFGENLDANVLAQTEDVLAQCDLCLVVSTGSAITVYYSLSQLCMKK